LSCWDDTWWIGYEYEKLILLMFLGKSG
jgi:hypothetical protein